ncbi:MAG TPA: GtrA family protein [archaeon]|nr:GtrA family protein [archaeon]
MFKRKKISFRDTLLTKKKTDFFHSVYYQLTSYSIFYSNKMFLKYATLGLIGTLVHLVILVILTELGLFYLFSAGVGITAGIYVNYLLNKKYIVKERTKNQKKASSLFTFLYFSISIITIILNLIILVIFVERYNMGYLLANIISSLLMFLTRYFCHKILFSKFGH